MLSKLVLRASLLITIVATAIIGLHLAADGNAAQGVTLASICVWGLIVVGGGAWAEYLESRIDPSRAQVLPSHWQANPTIVIPILSGLVALIAATIAALVQVYSHLPV